MRTTLGRGAIGSVTQALPSVGHMPLAGHAPPPAHMPSTVGQHGAFPARWLGEEKTAGGSHFPSRFPHWSFCARAGSGAIEAVARTRRRMETRVEAPERMYAGTHAAAFASTCLMTANEQNHTVDVWIRRPSRDRARCMGLAGNDADHRAAWS